MQLAGRLRVCTCTAESAGGGTSLAGQSNWEGIAAIRTVHSLPWKETVASLYGKLATTLRASKRQAHVAGAIEHGFLAVSFRWQSTFARVLGMLLQACLRTIYRHYMEALYLYIIVKVGLNG
jgi:hypothetical protein